MLYAARTNIPTQTNTTLHHLKHRTLYSKARRERERAWILCGCTTIYKMMRFRVDYISTFSQQFLLLPLARSLSPHLSFTFFIQLHPLIWPNSGQKNYHFHDDTTAKATASETAVAVFVSKIQHIAIYFW